MSDSAAAPPRVPGATGPQIRRRAAALASNKKEIDAPNSPRAAGAGGSSSTMMRLYTQDDNPGLKVDPVIVLSLAVVFVFSVVSLHLFTKVIRYFSK
ncbi:Pre protein translocase Sec Sec61-beta subunit [Leucosporidium creatinivorum]|uniref:Protein transport protein Sec61 subunit beta n=1 Tax=Leucosporidium creatinivorum TaxID=106004 RepID=A0A1Y2FW32_9BASI|nr:Pre protein translocase Sec Sec61-beta subunit [Leucosporidium creatinivorum]